METDLVSGRTCGSQKWASETATSKRVYALLGWYEQPFRTHVRSSVGPRVQSIRVTFSGRVEIDPTSGRLLGVVSDEFGSAMVEGVHSDAGLWFTRISLEARRRHPRVEGEFLPGPGSALLGVLFRFPGAEERAWVQGTYQLQSDETVDFDWCPGPCASAKLVPMR